MLSLIAQCAGKPSGIVPQAALSALLQQHPWSVQGLDAFLQSWESTARPIGPSSFNSDVVSSPSTSYPTSPFRHHHQLSPIPPQLQLQQTRSYRVAYRPTLPKVPYSVRSGREAPKPWPELERVKGVGAQGEIRWHRSVVRFPPEVSVELQADADGKPGERTLVLSGRAGTIRLSLQELDPTGLIALRMIRLPASAPAGASGPPAPAPGPAPAAAGSAAPPSASAAGGRCVLAYVSPDRERFEAVGAELNKAIRGVMTGYLLGLTVKGVGYRMEPVGEEENVRRPAPLNAAQLLRRSRDPNGRAGVPKPHYFESADAAAQTGAQQAAIAFPHNKPASAVRLKVGYSRAAIYPLPPHVRAFFIRPTLMYLYGVELDELKRVAAEIRSIRKPNSYTGNGIQYLDEVIKLKSRAGAK